MGKMIRMFKLRMTLGSEKSQKIEIETWNISQCMFISLHLQRNTNVILNLPLLVHLFENHNQTSAMKMSGWEAEFLYYSPGQREKKVSITEKNITLTE